MPQEVLSRLTSIVAADKIKISNDPIFQISNHQSPTLDDSPDTAPEISMTTTKILPCLMQTGRRPHFPAHIAPTIYHYPQHLLRPWQMVATRLTNASR
jgi:hypothetical protein